MKYPRAIACTFLLIVLCCCGGSSSGPKGINGAWSAKMMFPDGEPVITFTASMTQGSGTTVNVSNFESSCFPSGAAETGTFSTTGSTNDYQIGPFTMSVSTTVPEANSLTLTGGRDGEGNIAGTWSTTASLPTCTGHGIFTMCPSAQNPCAVTLP
jgi:hypothetical protein